MQSQEADPVARAALPENGPTRRRKGTQAIARDLLALATDPRVSINLMCKETAGNDPFFEKLVREFYCHARRRHPKLLFLRRLSYGVALARLPDSFDTYFMSIEAAARRNCKKAQRNGFTFSRIRYNDFLADVAEIRRSAEYRQGRMPEELLIGEVAPTNNPASTTAMHDYPYFGVQRDGKLYAYAGCLIAGEICLIEHIYGHARHHSEGIVPMLIISIAEHLLERHPAVKFFAYDTYYGAREEMRRFKRKFLFNPHRVKWVLGDDRGR